MSSIVVDWKIGMQPHHQAEAVVGKAGCGLRQRFRAHRALKVADRVTHVHRDLLVGERAEELRRELVQQRGAGIGSH